ncbi:MAG: hypothetical protein NDJ89_13830 [Oligoflexia bacterium]|nr:hypothetical protein [Oligoflexia bacterium]
MKSGWIAGCLLLALTTVACEGLQMPIQDFAGDPGRRDTVKGIGYGDVLPIFKSRCGLCHNPGTPDKNWQDYDTTYAKRAVITQRLIVQKSMPPGGMPISDNERNLIDEWIRAGAPFDAPGSDPVPAPEPSIEPEPTITSSPSPEPTGAPGGVPTYDEVIRPRIFEKTCRMCHNEATPDKNWLDYSVAYAKREVIYQRVVVLKNMPMGLPMSDAERQLVADWVAAGAPRNSGNAPLPTPTPTPTTTPIPSPTPSPDPQPTVPAGGVPGYEETMRPLIFGKVCSGCHNASSGASMPNWLDYDTAYAKRERIYQRVVVEKTMPLGAPMSDAERKLVADWVKGGAPRTVPQPEPTPTPTGTPPPGAPYSFESVIKPQVIEPICAACHNSATPEKNWLNYEVAYAKRDKLFKRVVVTREMPPAGVSMTEEQRELVRQWYLAGGPR